MRRLGRLARLLLVLVACGAGGAALLALHLRADKRHVFTEVAGELGEARVLETMRTAGGVARRIRLANDRGEVVAEAWVRRPARLAPDYRIALVYSGQETGRKILDLVPERDDLVLAAPQYPYRRPRSAGEYLTWPRDVRRAAFGSVAGGMLAVTHLERDEALDARRMLVIGASLGSSFAVIHAALDPRVPRLLIVHGGGDLPLVVRTIEERRGRPWRGRAEAALAAVLVDTFDPLHYVADVAPRELVVIGARGDHQFPAASTLALYRRAREPKTLRWTSGGHVRSSRNAVLDEVLVEIERLLAEDGGGRADGDPVVLGRRSPTGHP